MISNQNLTKISTTPWGQVCIMTLLSLKSGLKCTLTLILTARSVATTNVPAIQIPPYANLLLTSARKTLNLPWQSDRCNWTMSLVLLLNYVREISEMLLKMVTKNWKSTIRPRTSFMEIICSDFICYKHFGASHKEIAKYDKVPHYSTSQSLQL